MTNPELILKMIEMLLSERDKNNKLQSKLEEYQKSEGQKCHYIAESGKELQGFPTFYFWHKKSMCITGTHTYTNKQMTQS